jgi:hypothetical protein
MENVIYRKTILEVEQTEHGENSIQLEVTEEHNGFAVFCTGGFTTGSVLLEWFSHDRDKAIEFAVRIDPYTYHPTLKIINAEKKST